jgi:hypothetical protein
MHLALAILAGALCHSLTSRLEVNRSACPREYALTLAILAGALCNSLTSRVPALQVRSTQLQEAIERCKRGSYLTASRCQACPNGKFQFNAGASSCFSCPAGKCTPYRAGSVECWLRPQTSAPTTHPTATATPAPSTPSPASPATPPKPALGKRGKFNLTGKWRDFPTGQYKLSTGMSTCIGCPVVPVSQPVSQS